MNRMRICWCLVSFCILAIPVMSFGQVQQLPISALLDQIGSNPDWYDCWYDPATDRWLCFDDYGKLAEYYSGLNLGTTVEGSVTVRPLKDGGAQVSVLIHTGNALCFGYQGDFQGNYPLAFGYEPQEVGGQIAASLGEGTLAYEYTMPSPDSPLVGDYPTKSLIAVVDCNGQLRYGSGFPDGTPGRAHTAQKGVFATGVPSGCPPETNANCWPTEIIRFWPVGK
jgi:hypothetical protein